METEPQPYVIISKDGELVRLSTGMSNRSDYFHVLEISEKEGSVIYSEYGISDRCLSLAIEALGEIHEMTHSKVSEEVKGLIAKLKGETQ